MPSNNDGYNNGYGFPGGFGTPGFGGPDDEMRCSFCHKTRSQVNKLIAGQNGVCICDECVQACLDMIGEDAPTGDEGFEAAAGHRPLQRHHAGLRQDLSRWLQAS